MQSADRYQVLALSLDHIRLFEGNRHSLDEIELASGVPHTVTDALGEEVIDPQQSSANGGTGAQTGMPHSHGGRRDESDTEANHYFRGIDRAITAQYSRPSGLPLILAALPEHHGMFREISHNTALLAEGIKIDPESIGAEQLRDRAWEIMEPEYQLRLSGLADEYEISNAKGLGVEELQDVAKAAFDGRVATLLIEADRQITGRIHSGSGNLHLEEDAASTAEDLLDDLGEMVVKLGGRVFVLPAERMPSTTGAAAICRY